MVLEVAKGARVDTQVWARRSQSVFREVRETREKQQPGGWWRTRRGGVLEATGRICSRTLLGRVRQPPRGPKWGSWWNGGENPDSRGSRETEEKTGRLRTCIDNSEGDRGMGGSWQGRDFRLFKSRVEELVVCLDTWWG